MTSTHSFINSNTLDALLGRGDASSRVLAHQLLASFRGTAYSLYVAKTAAPRPPLKHYSSSEVEASSWPRQSEPARTSDEYGSPAAAAAAAAHAAPLPSVWEKNRGLSVLIYTQHDAAARAATARLTGLRTDPAGIAAAADEQYALVNPDQVKSGVLEWCSSMQEGHSSSHPLTCRVKVITKWPTADAIEVRSGGGDFFSFPETVRLMASTGLFITLQGSSASSVAAFMRHGAAILEVGPHGVGSSGTDRTSLEIEAATTTWVGSKAHGLMVEGLGLQHCVAHQAASSHSTQVVLPGAELARCLRRFRFK